MKYLFSDTDLAARRLEVLARVYRKSTNDFLHDAIDRPIESVTDLGCGPGFTTHQLLETLRPKQITGLDNSEHFISLARAGSAHGRTEHQLGASSIHFKLHDVTHTPFPNAPTDVIYSRYLLSHLKNVPDLVASWATQLTPRGLLLLEEPEWIETTQPDFQRYLEIVAAMLRSQGSELYIGPSLDCIEARSLGKIFSRVYRYRVSDRDAATMFSMNLPNWKNQSFIREYYAKDEIDALEGRLREVAGSSSDESHIEWGLRQIAFER